MLREPLPDRLGSRFRVAQALAAGVSEGRLRAGDLRAPFHGIRARTDPELPLDRFGISRGELERVHLQRAWEYSAWMPRGHFFSQVTAAVLWGMPLPPHLLRAAPIDIGVMAPARLPRGRGVRGHQTTASLTRVRRDPSFGVPVTSPASTWAMLGRILTDPYDLVAAADAVVRDWRVHRPLATLRHLEAAVFGGRRVGIGALRSALPRVRTRSASRPESHLRLTLIDAGLGEPELNHDIFEAGIRLACVDQAYPALKIALEYEGEHHLTDPGQWALDIRRYEHLAAAGWQVIRVTKADLFTTPHALVSRVRAAIAQRR